MASDRPLAPLFVITGASGAGKSTMYARLGPLLPDFAVLDLDDWIERFKNQEASVHPEVLRDAAALRKPVVLCGAVIPQNFEPLEERRAFGDIHYLALVCEDAELEPRLRLRDGWSTWGGASYLAYHHDFNQWIKANAALTTPPMTLLPTTGTSPDETVQEVRTWIRGRWS